MYKLITFFALVAVAYAAPGYLGAGIAAPLAYASPAVVAAAPLSYAASPVVAAAHLGYASAPVVAAAPLGYAAAPLGYGGIIKSHGILG